MQAQTTRDALTSGREYTQVEAVTINDRANAQASRANLSYLVGSGLLTLGISALIAELAFSGE